jgi:site-specific DNA-methyltransferase (adenine-specific)
MEEIIGGLRFDHILTDPPYLYIKTHAFDRPFDEALLFECAKRILPDTGFIALFGRGTSFYRWNTRLAELGFVFKEEIVWDKRYISAPCLALSRVHETISLHTKKKGKIRQAKVPYTEQKQFDIKSIVNDIKRIKSAIGSEAGLNTIIEFLKTGVSYTYINTSRHCVTQQAGIKITDRVTATLNSIQNGMNERSIVHCREAAGGMREKSVIELNSNHYKSSHPTQKPVRLAERLLALISDPGDTILDPFMGSGSFGIACVHTGRKYIGIEMSREYYETACARIRTAVQDQSGLFDKIVNL